MSAPCRPESLFLVDIEDLDGVQLQELFREPHRDLDRSLLGIAPGEDSISYPGSSSYTALPPGFPSSTLPDHPVVPHNPVSDGGTMFIIHNSLLEQPDYFHPVSYASGQIVPLLTLTESRVSTPAWDMESPLRPFTPNPTLAGREASVSPCFLDTESRSSGPEYLTPVSSPSVGYSSSEGIGEDTPEDKGLDADLGLGQARVDLEENQNRNPVRAFHIQGALNPLFYRPRLPALLESSTRGSALSNEKEDSDRMPISPRMSSTHATNGSDASFVLDQAHSRSQDDSSSQGKGKKRKRQRKVQACVRCQVLHLRVSH